MCEMSKLMLGNLDLFVFGGCGCIFANTHLQIQFYPYNYAVSTPQLLPASRNHNQATKQQLMSKVGTYLPTSTLPQRPAFRK